MAEIPEDDDCAADLAELNRPPQAGLRLFPMAVVALAVFPIALGIGFTLQAVSPTSAKLEAAVEAPPPIPNHIEPVAKHLHPAGQDRSRGDDLLREGRYEAALQHYRSLGSADPLRMATELAIRIGFCQEGLGLWDEALGTYRRVAGSANPVISTSAVLGQGRVWMRLNDFASAEELLRSLLFHSAEPNRVPPDVVAEIVLLHAIAVAEQAILEPEQESTSGLSAVDNVIEWSFADALKWADAKSVEQTGPTLDETPQLVTHFSEANSPENDLILPELVRGRDPLARSLRIVARRQSSADILTRVITDCGLRLEWSDAAKERAASRAIDVNFCDWPLVIALTAVCRECGADWTFQPQTRTISVFVAETGPDVQRIREVGTALLAGSMALYPNHRLTGAAAFARAQLAVSEGRQGDAAVLYSSLVGRATSPLAIRAAFNAALAYHHLGDLIRTCQSLEVVVYGAPGNELHTRSLILYGRTLMDRGEFLDATYQLRRATASRHAPEEQARAAVFLAMAELLDGKPHEAAESLFAHRLQFQDRTVRNAAALMTSIARWRTATTASRNREAAFLYRSVVAVQPQSDWLGAPGQLLLGEAMRDVNLDDQMAELYSSALARGAPKLIEVRMRLGLADYWMTHDRAADAKSIWVEVLSANSVHSPVAGMRLATAALDEHEPDACLKLCRTLQTFDGIPRADLQKLAGRAYEQSGNPLRAAQCYAGTWPIP